jgi:hypothetical protein
MSTGITVGGLRTAISTGAVRRRARFFYLAAAGGVAATTFVGFAPTYYLKALYGTPPLSPLLHLHGLIFTAWFVLFGVQTILVAAHRTDLHRRLGAAGVLLAVTMVGVGLSVAVGAARRGMAPPGTSPLGFLVFPIGVLGQFTLLVAVGLYLRRRTEIHKRLMLFATIALLGPALARIPGIGPWTQVIIDAGVGLCLVHDGVVARRLYPASVIGGLFVVISGHFLPAIGTTQTWMTVAAWLTR